MRIWLDGALIPAEAGRIDPADRGFTLGDGIFETIAVRGGSLCRIDAHLRRFAEGQRVLDLPLPVSETALVEAAQAVLAANGLSDGSVRVTLARGPGARGLPVPRPPKPTLLITASFPPPTPGPAAVVVATVTRRNELSPLARIKALNYLDNILARLEAERRGADDAVLLNTRGTVACGTVANLFAVIGGNLITPPVEDGAMPGTCRGALIEHLGALPRTLSADDLRRASEVFLTNSLGVRPVVRIDGATIGDGAAGPVTREAMHRV